jgi:hypothetical protein
MLAIRTTQGAPVSEITIQAEQEFSTTRNARIVCVTDQRFTTRDHASKRRWTMAKIALLSKHDLEEVEKFRQFLSDLQSNMPDDDFAKKWCAYMDVNEEAAKAYYNH